MSWNCHISNMKGFLIHHHPETFMQKHSNGRMAVSLACLKLRLQPRQANQCHIVVNGECWVGQFAVWRFPVMQPSDIQVWEACPLPEHAWFVPDNGCICTTVGSGCVSLGGGDYDGDLLMFTSNPILLEFLSCTPSGTEVHQFNAARAQVEGLVEKSSPTKLRSIMQYREHCLHVPTPQIRGLLTALAERAQQQVFDASDPERDAALINCVRLAVAAEKAYDAPKKVDAKSIIQLGRRLLKDAGLTIQSPRSTQQIREAFKLKRVYKEPHKALHTLRPLIPLGKAWLPLNRVTLSGAAGHAIRDRMFHPKCMNGLADPLEHMALDEVAGVLFHRLASVPNLRSSVQNGNLDALIHGAQNLHRSKPKEINAVETIETTNLY